MPYIGDKPSFDSIWESTLVEEVGTKKKSKKIKLQPRVKKNPPLSKIMEMHKPGCFNENPTFTIIRDLYPNIKPAYLFDLFEKCGGDADWTANVLIEDDNVEKNDKHGKTDGELNCICSEEGAEW